MKICYSFTSEFCQDDLLKWDVKMLPSGWTFLLSSWKLHGSLLFLADHIMEEIPLEKLLSLGFAKIKVFYQKKFGL